MKTYTASLRTAWQKTIVIFLCPLTKSESDLVFFRILLSFRFCYHRWICHLFQDPFGLCCAKFEKRLDAVMVNKGCPVLFLKVTVFF
jgi:hypothetical protein